MKLITLMAFVAVLLVMARSASPEKILWINAQIYAMDASDSQHEAMLSIGGVIRSVGSSAQLQAQAPPGTRIVDLGGQAVLPGFVDAHSHFPASHLKRAGLDLSAPPFGEVSDIATLLSRVEAAASEQEEGRLILGFNYDNTLMESGRHPTREELDAVAAKHPVWLAHSSGHMGVGNSLALKSFGRVPEGDGLLQESDAPELSSLVFKLLYRKLAGVLFEARDAYLAEGVTTVQNGRAARSAAWMLWLAQRLKVLPQRVIVWPAHESLGAPLLENSFRLIPLLPSSSNTFNTGAIKLIVDGSPQGLTAWLSTPYPATAGKVANYYGIPVIKSSALTELVVQYHRAGYQLAMHGNGDGAIDAILDAVEQALDTHVAESDAEQNAQGDVTIDPRHLIVHAQTLRHDQVLRMRELNVSASFFPTHTYYWGKWHETVALGPRRASILSPLAWADAAGVPYTIHSDSPVTPMLPMQMIWSVTRRETLEGKILGPELRIDRLRALRSITIDAAWQNHMEDFIGSLEPGKFADFIVLSADPQLVEDVRTVKVDQTWIDGVREYIRPGAVEPAELNASGD